MSRLARALFLPVCLAVIVAAGFIVPLPVFVETPREPVSLDERVVVAVEDATLRGDYLLLAVTLSRGTVARLLQAVVDADRTVVAEAQLLPPHEDDDTYFARQRDVFEETAAVAAAVGLQAAGYTVDPREVTGSGVLVAEVVPGTPAENRLAPGDVIVAVDGTPVRGFEDLRAVMPDDAGAALLLDVERDDEHVQVELETAALQTADGTRPGVGILGQTHEPRIDLPVDVAVDGGGIGGPSAGLMVALTVYDKAARDVDLAAGRNVAGTGRIDQDGNVGAVGGVRQKVAAAEATGAEVLVVPAALLDTAKAARRPGSTLEIIGVATFDEARDALLDGGSVTLPVSTRAA